MDNISGLLCETTWGNAIYAPLQSFCRWGRCISQVVWIWELLFLRVQVEACRMEFASLDHWSDSAEVWQGSSGSALLALSETAHCPISFSLSPLLPLGMETLAYVLMVHLSAFPLSLLPAVLMRVREDRVLVSPFWPFHHIVLSDLVSLMEELPWEIWGAFPKSIVSQLWSQVPLNSIGNVGTCDHRCFW